MRAFAKEELEAYMKKIGPGAAPKAYFSSKKLTYHES
jgi:hypothetical protein